MIILNKAKLTIIGGDNRYAILKDLLTNDGFTVHCYKGKVSDIPLLKEYLSNSEAVICPIPFTKDNINVNIPSLLSIDTLFSAMENEKIPLLAAGVLSPPIINKASHHSICACDIFSYEETALYNAIPTAEGAIMTAIAESERVIYKSNVLVIGFGRCGKVLSSALKGIGAYVTATYRKSKDKALIYTYGIDSLHTDDLSSALHHFDFIFNTAPAPVLTSDNMINIKKTALIIDIAQAPGGIDYSYAREEGIKALYCPGLPGRVAPYTAACVIKDALYDIISEHLL